MIQKKEFKTDIGGRTLTLEISSLAEQATAAVVAKYGDTVVLATAVMSDREATTDYFPLKVDYEERFYAAGKILGSRFIRREGRPSEDAILSGRLMDRTIRPLFNQRLRRETQVVLTTLAYDGENDPDFVGLMGISTALAISSIPWNGPVAAVRIAKMEGKLLVNPTASQIASPDCAFETFVAGPKGTINMVEFSGKEIPETEVLEAFTRAQKEIDALSDFVSKIAHEIGAPKAETKLAEIDAKLRGVVEAFLKTRLEGAVYQPNKMEQQARLVAVKNELFEHVRDVYAATDESFEGKAVEMILEEMVDALVHENILKYDRRPDGRKLDEVRALQGETALFERTHGSALFVRGNTQALAVTTLAAPGAEQIMESMTTDTKRRFMLHYNFPPYSVGEIGNFRGPGRREIGHGALAKKAIEPLIPSTDVFPYTIRVVSEVLSSNGSSSMATTCASILSLMDAGVPIKKPAAGIAMGLILGENPNDKSQNPNYKILTDIQGPEDHYGDMDFKVAGTDAGVTAIQLDVKVEGLTHEIIEKTLAQARTARLHILQFMSGVLEKPREKLSQYAPSIFQMKIDPEKIGLLIGPGGKTINGLIKKYNLETIDVEEDGSVFVASIGKREEAEAAILEITALTKEFKVGDTVEGAVVKILEFGAIVDLGGGRDGMIHVSELKEGFTKSVEDVVHVGDFVRAKVIRVEDGRIGLSIKQLTGRS